MSCVHLNCIIIILLLYDNIYMSGLCDNNKKILNRFSYDLNNEKKT